MATQAPRTVSSVPDLAREREVRWPERSRSLLANGLEVILVESHTIPKFHGELFFRSGNAAAAGRAVALAEMTASMVRTGTQKHSSREIEEQLRGLGADLAVSAGQDTTAVSFAGLSDHAEPLLRLVNELAREASFPAAEFDRERRQRLEEVKLERTQPGFLASERLRKVLFGSHPYALVSPSEEQVEAYTIEQLASLYRDFYTPANAVLLLVGDFDPRAMQTSVETFFGDWSGSKPESVSSVRPPALRGRRVYLVDVPGAVQAQLLCGCQAVNRRHPDWIKLSLTNSLYGGAFNSRLVMNIREDKGYTYSPRSSVNPLREYGYFTVSAAVRNEVVAASLSEVLYEIDRLRSVPVSGPELLDAQNYQTGVFSLGLATQSGLLSQFSTLALNELPDDYLETYRQKVRALGPEDVLGAARSYFDSANMQIVVVGDRKQIESQAALFGELELFDTKGNRLTA